MAWRRRLWLRNGLGRQRDAELHEHLAPWIVAAILAGLAVACGRGDTVPPDGAELATPAAAVTTVVGELLLPFRGTRIQVLGSNLYVLSHSPVEFRRVPLAGILPSR